MPMHDSFRWWLTFTVIAFYGFGVLALALSNRTAREAFYTHLAMAALFTMALVNSIRALLAR